MVVADGVEVDAGVGLQARHGLGALDRDQRGGQALVGNLTGVTDGGADMVQVGSRVPRVDDDHEVSLARAVDQAVVNDATLVVADQVVTRLALDEVAHLVGHDLLQCGQRGLAHHAELAHVGDVEGPDAGANSHVLLAHGAVLQRHRPAAELHHLRPGRQVAVVERGAQRGRALAHSSGPAPGSLRRGSGSSGSFHSRAAMSSSSSESRGPLVVALASQVEVEVWTRRSRLGIPLQGSRQLRVGRLTPEAAAELHLGQLERPAVGHHLAILALGVVLRLDQRVHLRPTWRRAKSRKAPSPW